MPDFEECTDELCVGVEEWQQELHRIIGMMNTVRTVGANSKNCDGSK
jgi:hypothetical protein